MRLEGAHQVRSIILQSPLPCSDSTSRFQNGMENLPIWFAAVVSIHITVHRLRYSMAAFQTVGHIAGVPNRTLNLFSIA